MENEFDGVFRFTNVTDEDFTALWNNKEYVLPAGKTVPMIIPGEPLENIQEIRKKWAYKLAVREFYKGKDYANLVKLGNKSAGGMPPIYDEAVLQPLIDSCLKPLPIARATVREVKKVEPKFKSSKAISSSANPNFEFKDEPVPELGEMPK